MNLRERRAQLEERVFAEGDDKSTFTLEESLVEVKDQDSFPRIHHQDCLLHLLWPFLMVGDLENMLRMAFESELQVGTWNDVKFVL